MTLPLSGRLIRTFTGWLSGPHQLAHCRPTVAASAPPGGMSAGPGSGTPLACSANESRLPLASVSRTSGTPCREQGVPLWLVNRTPPTSTPLVDCHEPAAEIWNAVHGRVPGGAVGRGAAGVSPAGASIHSTAPGLSWN